MSVSVNSAIAAYREALSRMSSPAGLEARSRQEPSFENLVKSGLDGALKTMQQGETASRGAVTGKAELTDVVTAVTNAELTLQTVVAVRDRVIQAYQEILRMPI